MTTATFKFTEMHVPTEKSQEVRRFGKFETIVRDAVNGRHMSAYVYRQRDWLWIGFPEKPSEEWRKKLVGIGFMWSRKRISWHAEASDGVVEFLKGIGCLLVDLHWDAPKPKANVDGAAPAKQRKPKGKSKTAQILEQRKAQPKPEADAKQTPKQDAKQIKPAAKPAAKPEQKRTPDKVTQVLTLLVEQQEQMNKTMLELIKAIKDDG